jgi:hypothetical protein
LVEVLTKTRTTRVNQQDRPMPILSELAAQKIGTSASKNYKSRKEENRCKQRVIERFFYF